MKNLIVLIFCAAFTFKAQCQVYYFQSSGNVTVSANSILLPTTIVTPSGVTSTNPNSQPVAYSTAFSNQINTQPFKISL